MIQNWQDFFSKGGSCSQFLQKETGRECHEHFKTFVTTLSPGDAGELHQRRRGPGPDRRSWPHTHPRIHTTPYTVPGTTPRTVPYPNRHAHVITEASHVINSHLVPCHLVHDSIVMNVTPTLNASDAQI